MADLDGPYDVPCGSDGDDAAAADNTDQEAATSDADLAFKLSALALLRRESGSLTQAEEYQRRALALAERVHGPDHASVAASVSNLACIIQKFGNLGEAEKLHRR